MYYIVHKYFESFAEMIDGLPPKGVCRAAEMQRRMLEDDLAWQRDQLTGEKYSVLDFCHFLESAGLGPAAAATPPPLKHVAFYRKTVDRLVAAGELPPAAMEQFDAAFASGFFRVLSA